MTLLLTHPACQRSRDDEAIHHFLTMMYVPSPGTGFSGIKKLPAGHTLTVELRTGQEAVERDWAVRYVAGAGGAGGDWEGRVVRGGARQTVLSGVGCSRTTGGCRSGLLRWGAGQRNVGVSVMA